MSTNWQGSVFTQAVTFESPWVLSSLTHSKDGFHFKVDDKCSFPPLKIFPTHLVSHCLLLFLPRDGRANAFIVSDRPFVSPALMVHGRVSIQRLMVP